MRSDVTGQADALPWQPGDAAIAAEVTQALERGRSCTIADLLGRLPAQPATEVRRVVLLLVRAGTLLVEDGGYPPRYRLS